MTTDREVCYITREVVQQALTSLSTAGNQARIDRCIQTASRDVEGLTHRRFYPWSGTRYKTWQINTGPTYKVWLDASEVVSVDELTVDGAVISSSDYFLEPQAYGPPYSSIELDRATASTFAGGELQRNIAIEGVFMGCELRESAAGTVATTVNDSITTLVVSDGGLVGVGNILRIGTERVQVTEKRPVDTTQTINASLAAQNNVVTVSVDTGSAFNVGEIILIDAEKMRIDEITGNSLHVRRAFDGSVLATHASAAGVWVYRSLSIVRGVLGTVAAAHNSAAPILVFEPPSLVQELTLAYTLNNLEQGSNAYARQVGSGDNQRESGGRGVRDIEKDCYRKYGRKARIRSS